MPKRIMQNIKASWRGFLGAGAGSAAIEFAMVVPVLILMIVGIVEYSIIMYDSAILEGAVSAAARVGRTGYDGVAGDTDPQTRLNYMRTILKNKITGAMSPSKVVINSLGSATIPSGTAVSCDPSKAIGTTSTPPPCDAGGSADYVQYQVTYPLSLAFLPFVTGKSSSTWTIAAYTIVKNEKF